MNTDKIRSCPVRFTGSDASDLAIQPEEIDAVYKAAFIGAAHNFFETALDRLDDPGTLVAAGIVAEGIALLEEAARFACAAKSNFRANDGVYVSFKGMDGRARCVRLSAISQRLLQLGVVTPATPAHGMAALEFWYAAFRHAQPIPMPKTGLAALQHEAAAFWVERLPGALALDALGLLSIAPCTTTVLARLATGRPLRRDRDASEVGAQLSAECVVAIESQGADRTADFGTRVKSAMAYERPGRLADLRIQQLTLLKDLAQEVGSDELAGLQLLVAVGLCTTGTVMSLEPSQSATRRYAAEWVDLTEAHPDVAVRLPYMSAQERGKVYDEWIPLGKTPADASAALSAADMFLASEFDLEPAHVRNRSWEKPRAATTRLLCEQELNSIARAIPQIARTAEIAMAATAIFVLARHSTVRPGDVIDARWEDLEIDEDRVVFNVCRRRGKKGQKTSASEHTHTFNDVEHREPLTKLSVFWEQRGAMRGDFPLWGADDQDSQRIFAAAISLISTLCRRLTGDVSQSFYSLRHSFFTREILPLLMPGDALTNTKKLKKIAARGGHRSIATSIVWYFHLPMEVVRAHADLAIKSLLSTDLASRWAGVGSNAVQQHAHRHALEIDGARLSIIASHVDAQAFRDVSEIHLCEPLAHADLKRDAATLDDVLCTLGAIDPQSWSEATEIDSSRISLSAWEVAVIGAARMFAACAPSKIRLAQVAQHKLKGVRRQLALYRNSPSNAKVCELWSRGRGGFIDATDSNKLEAWLRFFQACRFPISRIVVRITEPESRYRVSIEHVFAAVAGTLPAVEEVPGGYKRPDVYLLLSSEELVDGSVASPAMVNMNGFNTLMFAACVRRALNNLSIQEGE